MKFTAMEWTVITLMQCSAMHSAPDLMRILTTHLCFVNILKRCLQPANNLSILELFILALDIFLEVIIIIIIRGPKKYLKISYDTCIMTYIAVLPHTPGS